MAMPWSRGKQIAAALRGDSEFPEGYTGSRTIAQLNELFDSCFRIQREAGGGIPLVVENVKGAEPWVGAARWHFGSFYLWGDVPALMPSARHFKTIGHANKRDGHTHARHLTNHRESEGVKIGGSGDAYWRKPLEAKRREATAIKNGKDWFGSGENCSLQRRAGSGTTSRKAASALIAKIPLELSRHVARCYRPLRERAA